MPSRSGTNVSHSAMPTGISIFGRDIASSPFFANGAAACRYTYDTE